MRTSARGRAFIGAHEGLRLQAYKDPVGVWTIGYGHTNAAGPPRVKAGLTISEAEANAILATDLRKYEGYVNDAVTVKLRQHEFDALVSFTFNLGPTNLKRSTLLRKLNAGDKQGAATEFGKWVNAGGRKLPGLVRRRAEERTVFLFGQYPSGAAQAPQEPRERPKPVPGPSAPEKPAAPPKAAPAKRGGIIGAIITIALAIGAAVAVWLGIGG